MLFFPGTYLAKTSQEVGSLPPPPHRPEKRKVRNVGGNLQDCFLVSGRVSHRGNTIGRSTK